MSEKRLRAQRPVKSEDFTGRFILQRLSLRHHDGSMRLKLSMLGADFAFARCILSAGSSIVVEAEL